MTKMQLHKRMLIMQNVYVEVNLYQQCQRNLNG